MKLARLLFAFCVLTILTGCGDDDDPGAPAGPTVGKVAGAMVPYTSVVVELRGYPQGAQLLLRAGYWNPGQLSDDPQAVVTQLSGTSFNVEFASLDGSSFIAPDAEILLVVVSSTADELSGVVVLCTELGPIIVDPGCAGDCVPDCGLPGVGCDG